MDKLKSSIYNVFSFGDLKNTPDKLNISYGVDKNFLFGVAISMQSIVMNNREIIISFHIFTDYFDKDYKDRITVFCNNNVNANVTIYLVSKDLMNIFPQAKQWSYATFFRFIAFDYLADRCDNLLYIDADVICKGSLKELLEVKLEKEYYAAVVKDNDFMQENSSERLNLKGLSGNYFNAGFIYLNTEEWGRNRFTDQVLLMLASDKNHTKYKCLDQDILNILFFKHCYFLDDKFNKLYGVDYELNFASDREYLNYINHNTRLIHYVGITKPWHNWTHYPSEKYFYKAYHFSEWKDFPLIFAKGESQFKAKSMHEKKNGQKLSSLHSFIKYRVIKLFRKFKEMCRII